MDLRVTLENLEDPWQLSQSTVSLLRDSRRVLPVIGAGLSRAARLPDAAELARLLRQEHPLAAGIEFDLPDNLRDVASRIGTDAAKRRSVRDFVIDQFREQSEPAHVPPTIEALVRVPSKWIITFNYDDFAERAAAAQNIAYESCTWRNIPVFDPYEQKSLRIVHLHGSLEDPESLVLDADSYRELQDRNSVERFCSSAFGALSACFFGTALDEEYLNSWLISWSAASAPKHVYVTDEPGAAAAQHGRAALTQAAQGIVVESFPKGRFDLLDDFCKALVEKPANAIAAHEPESGAPSSSLDPEVGASPPVRVEAVTSDWGPGWTRTALKDLVRHAPDEALHLQQELASDSTPARVVSLIEAPPQWLLDASERAWIVVARFAEQQGDWASASTAWKRGAQIGGMRATRCLVGASVAADLAGDKESASALLSRAEDADPLNERLRLQLATARDDGEGELLDLASSSDEDIAALAHANLSISFTQRSRFNQARTHAEAAVAVRPDLHQARIAMAAIQVHENRERLAQGQRVAAQRLEDAVRDCTRLHDELGPMRRYDELSWVRSLKAEAQALLGEWDAAENTLRGALGTDEVATQTRRVVLADSALRCQQPRAASALLGGVEETDAVRAMRAQIALDAGSKTDQEAAIRALGQLIGVGGYAAHRAAMARATRAHLFPDAGWSAEAAGVLRDHGQPETAIATEALWLAASKRPDEALDLLKPYQRTRWAAEVVLQIEVWNGNPERTAQAARELLTLAPDDATRIMCAGTLINHGDVDGARAVVRDVAEDPGCPTSDRGEAYALLTQIVANADRNYTEVVDLCHAWVQIVPDDPRQIWQRAKALSRLLRYREALELVDRSPVVPETVEHAQLLAVLFARSRDPVEALRRLVALRELLPSADATIDNLITQIQITRVGERALPEDIAGPVEQFTDIGTLDGITVDVADVPQILAERRDSAEAIALQVLRGKNVAAAVGDVTGRDLGTTWHNLRIKPAGFGDAVLDDIERANAQHALQRGAIWDATAFYADYLLQDAWGGLAREAFADRRIAQATLDDIDSGTSGVLFSEAQETSGELLLDEQTGRPIIVDPSEADVANEKARAALTVASVQDFKVEPNRDQTTGEFYPTNLDDAPGRLALKGAFATLEVARRTGLAIYSDDRVLRQLARGLGLRAFGTIHLVQEFRRRGWLDPKNTLDAVARLRFGGYRGLIPLEGELEALAAKPLAEGLPLLRHAFSDPDLWRNALGGQLIGYVRFLRAAHRARPDWFGATVAGTFPIIVDAAAELGTAAGNHASHSQIVVSAGTWVVAISFLGESFDDEQRRFVAATRRVLGRHSSVLAAQRQTLHRAIGHLVDFDEGSPDGLRPIHNLLFVIVQLPLQEQSGAIRAFLRDQQLHRSRELPRPGIPARKRKSQKSKRRKRR